MAAKKKDISVEEVEEKVTKVEHAATMPVSTLEGVGPKTTQKLENEGIKYIVDLAIRDIPSIQEVTALSRTICSDIITQAKQICNEEGLIKNSYMTGREALYYRQKDLQCISTGSPLLDEWFGKGVETECITEVFGEFGSGKTQFCHTMAIMTQLPKNKGGVDGDVLWIDAEDTFRPERIVEIALARKLASNEEEAYKFLDRIDVIKPMNSAHQEMVMGEISSRIGDTQIKNPKYNPKLMIIDSITANFRHEYIGRGKLAEKQQRLGKYATLAGRAAKIHKMAAIITNQVVGNPDGFGEKWKPAGGHSLGHISMYRIRMKKGSKGITKLNMYDSPHHPVETEFVVARNIKGIIQTKANPGASEDDD